VAGDKAGQWEAWYRQAIPLAEQRSEDYLNQEHAMSCSEFHRYTRDEFLGEFYPDPVDKAAIAAGMEQLRAEQRAFRLARCAASASPGPARSPIGWASPRAACPAWSTPSQAPPSLRTLAAPLWSLPASRTSLQRLVRHSGE
jgi:hypothetical protein